MKVVQHWALPVDIERSILLNSMTYLKYALDFTSSTWWVIIRDFAQPSGNGDSRLNQTKPVESGIRGSNNQGDKQEKRGSEINEERFTIIFHPRQNMITINYFNVKLDKNTIKEDK